MSSRNNKYRDFQKIILRFEKNFPNLKNNLNGRDLSLRLNGVTHCEISGIPFSSLDRVYPVPIYILDENIINANRIILVNRVIKLTYCEIYNYIEQNPHEINVSDFNKSNARFTLSKEQAFQIYKDNDIIDPKNLFIHENFDHIFERYETKTKQELININILASREKEIINNLDKKLDNSHFILHRTNALPIAPAKKVCFSKKQILSKIKRCHERSKSKGLTCDMTYENSKHLFEIEYCQITGMKLNKSENKNGKNLPDTFTLDRINRFEGYNIHNIAVICHEANDIKGKLEKFNYTEDTQKIKKILEETRFRIQNKYKGNSSYGFKKKPVNLEKFFHRYTTMRKESRGPQFSI